MICSMALATSVLTACTNDDNPIPGVDDVENPQESVTDQPAN